MERKAVASDPDFGRRMAKYAAAGAVLALPVPFVGPVTGAVVGACYAFYRAQKRV